MNEETKKESISRAEAVKVLMQLQRAAAKRGEVELVEAVSMGIYNIVRRHRQSCRNKAKRAGGERDAHACGQEAGEH